MSGRASAPSRRRAPSPGTAVFAPSREVAGPAGGTGRLAVPGRQTPAAAAPSLTSRGGEERKHLEPFCARPRARPGCSAGILLPHPSAAATPGHGRRHPPPAPLPPRARETRFSLVEDERGRPGGAGSA